MTEITFYTDQTPNGWKIEIMLNELGMEEGKEYTMVHTDISKGDQFQPDYLKISPNGKIPAIEFGGDSKYPLFDSGAILIYLAETYKPELIVPAGSKNPNQRYTTLAWLMFQMAHVGPMLGQFHHFNRAAPEKISYAINRYGKESDRLHEVMNKHLAESPYLAGDDITIVDIATMPWLLSHKRYRGEEHLPQFPKVKDWYDKLCQRPAFAKFLAKFD